jgi:hypothetical protein
VDAAQSLSFSPVDLSDKMGVRLFHVPTYNNSEMRKHLAGEEYILEKGM